VDAYDRAIAELYALASRGVEPGLDRVRAALLRAGSPDRKMRAVHVAGTNGKGSIAAMIATGLAPRHRVGLYTSPHLASLTERTQILGERVDRGDVARAWERVREACIGEGAPEITFFEAVTVLAFDLFASREVDIAVLEVGLGGRLDATNVIEAPLACAVSRIGMDHMRILGNDIATIAREKAGILKRGVPAVIAPQREEARRVIEEEAARLSAPLIEPRFDLLEDRARVHTPKGAFDLAPRLLGAHQYENAAVAATVLAMLEGDPKRGVEEVSWPGRLERIAADGSFLLDGAHNVDGCEALATYLAQHPRPRVLLFGVMMDKEWERMIDLLAPHASEIVCAAPPLARALDPNAIAARVGGQVARDVDDAIDLARRSARGREIVVAGSLYLLGEVRARLLGIPRDPPIAM
jgi:dihydrofolate synthase / folylpolyglutamate synthase